jgi:hypothetical protein
MKKCAFSHNSSAVASADTTKKENSLFHSLLLLKVDRYDSQR